MKFNLKNLNKTDYFKAFIPLVFGLVHYLVRDNLTSGILYGLGWYLGIVLMIMDKNYIYKYYYESIHLKEDKFARLVTRSILFIVSYFGLSLFLITSSGSSLGMGLVMGIGLVLGFEMWHSKSYVDFFNQYFIQAKKHWTQKEIDYFIRMFLVFYLVMSVFSVT